ncbi:hypothetical protein ACHHV8_04955 [Paenibacillus sp. TAB 01]|uniref:hypothetical protein n=1 Tax=Paenibacillus sp. TAB 01 TaxID=3368988 RepID=UPI0037512EC8
MYIQLETGTAKSKAAFSRGQPAFQAADDAEASRRPFPEEGSTCMQASPPECIARLRS